MMTNEFLQFEKFQPSFFFVFFLGAEREKTTNRKKRGLECDVIEQRGPQNLKSENERSLFCSKN